MSAEDELNSIAEAIEALLPRFIDSDKESFLRSEDQAEFKRLAVEAKALLDVALGLANDFSMNLYRAINAGSGGFFGGPSYALVEEAAQLLRGAVNHMRRRPLADRSSLRLSALASPYVDPSRLAEIRGANIAKWDLRRLAQLCGELNIAHENDCPMTIAMLVRAIVDHVPPIFSARTFSEVANNYAGTRSFKGSMQKLHESLRHIADAHLHTQIRSRESIPTATQVNFSQELDVLLQEVIRLVH